MKNILYILGRFSYYIFPLDSFQRKITFIKAVFFTGIASRSFKKFGKNVVFHRNLILFGQEFISIGNNVSIGANGTLTAWGTYGSNNYNPEIIIEDDVTIGEGFHITAINKIHIGKGVLTGKYVTISDNSHGTISESEIYELPSRRKLTTKGSVIVGERVWIGDKVTILAGVQIGSGCIIGANSVVTKSFSDNLIIAGNPAKIIKVIKEKKYE